MLRIIREEEPPRPSLRLSTTEKRASISAQRQTNPARLSRLVKGELDWIVMKCLEKDRDRRYESASALAADVERYLTGEAVEACPPSATYRFRKYAGRHKAALSTAAIVLATLLLGIAGTSWQAWRATKAKANAETERANAVASFRSAQDAVDQLLAEVEENEMLQNPEMQPLRGKLLEIARDYFQEFVEKHQDNPQIQRDLAEAYRRLGDIAWILGDGKVADQAHSQAVAILEKLVAAKPHDDDLRHDLAVTALEVADVPRRGQDVYLSKAVESAKDSEKPAHRLTYAKACSAFAKWNLHQFREASGDPRRRDAGRALAEQSEKLLLELLKAQPESEEIQIGLADVQDDHGYVHLQDHTKAGEYFTRCCTTL
jgi:tetratricopeptide (TPR) repeat protein